MVPVSLTCRVEPVPPATVIHLDGALRVDTVGVFRTAAHKCLTDEPAAVVADLSGVDEFEDIALTIFPAVSRAASAWSGAQLILCSAGPALADRLEHMAVCRETPLVGDPEEALRLARNGAGPPIVREHLPATKAAVSRARAIIRDVLSRHALGSIADVGELVVAELVTNAIRHGRPPVSLAVAVRRGRLHVSVADASGVHPRVRSPDPETGEGRRGLLIVEALTVAWGVIPTGAGKVVWATLREADRDHRSTTRDRPLRPR